MSDWKRAAPGLALMAACFVAAGCSSEPNLRERNEGVTAPPAADVYSSPLGGWSGGVATWCDHGNRVYFADSGSYAGGGLAVVPADRSCAGEAR